MAPSYKLTYFDGRGRAETCRLAFAAAGVPFEDVRITFEDWSTVKPTTPTGTLPVLEMNGQKFSQSVAMATFLAREFGLYGSSNMDGLMIDMIQQQREDFLSQKAKVVFAPNEEVKTFVVLTHLRPYFNRKEESYVAENQKKLDEQTTPTTFKFYNDTIKNNKGGNGYAVGNKLSLADLVIYEGTQFCITEKNSLLDQYPEIKTLRSKVESGDKIKKYLAARKETQF